MLSSAINSKAENLMAATFITALSSFQAEECEATYNSCKGPGTNYKRKLVEIITTKNAAQRKGLRDAFSAIYKEDLCKYLQAQLRGKAEKAVLLWMRDPAERDAIIARNALASWCTDFRALTEILCSRTPTEILRIREAYYNLYKTFLEEDIAQETVGPHHKLLFALAKANRCPSKDVDQHTAKCDARRLYDCREGRIGIDEGAFLKILSQRNLNHLRATFAYYKQFYGHDIVKVLRSGEFEHALRILIKCIYTPAKYFAKVVQISLQGFETDDTKLSRIMVTRAEVDMAQIKSVYNEKYGMSIEQAIRKKTCGTFTEFLLHLARFGES